MPRLSRSKSMFSDSAMLNRKSRAAIASLAVSMVLSRYRGMLPTNSAIQLYLCQEGLGFISNGASRLSIHFIPLKMVDVLFQTSALHADSCPPLAYEVSIAG